MHRVAKYGIIASAGCVLLGAWTASGRAQVPDAVVYVGLVRSDIVHAAAPFEPRTGFAIAISQPIFLKGAFGLLIEPMFVQAGARPAMDVPENIEDVRVDYIGLHLLGRLRLDRALGPLSPWVLGGAGVAVRGKCSFGFVDSDDRSRECGFVGLQQIGLESPWSDTNFSWAAGGGVDLPVPHLGLMSLGVRFMRSLDKPIIGTTDTSPRHAMHIITLGITMPS